MRLPTTLLTRVPQGEPVPFREILPLKLKSSVSGKGDKTSEVCCVQEMTIMFSCFKINEFNQSMCAKEIESFQKCYMDNMNTRRAKKEQELKGNVVTGQRDIPFKQLNKILKHYPHLK